MGHSAEVLFFVSHPRQGAPGLCLSCAPGLEHPAHHSVPFLSGILPEPPQPSWGSWIVYTHSAPSCQRPQGQGWGLLVLAASVPGPGLGMELVPRRGLLNEYLSLRGPRPVLPSAPVPGRQSTWSSGVLPPRELRLLQACPCPPRRVGLNSQVSPTSWSCQEWERAGGQNSLVPWLVGIGQAGLE